MQVISVESIAGGGLVAGGCVVHLACLVVPS